MSAQTAERPRQVTFLGWSIMSGSVVVVLLAFQTVSSLQSLDTREAVIRFLSEPPGDGLGLTVDGTLTIMRTLAMVAAGCATAAAILGWHVLQRNRSARLALSLLAAPLLVSGLVLGGFLSSLVAAATVMLWLQPARAWLDGRDVPARTPVAPEPPAPPSTPTHSGAEPHLPPSAATGPAPWRPTAPYGSPESAPASAPVASAVTRRPASIRAACLTTWIFAGMGIVSTLAGVVLFSRNPQAVISDLYKQNPELANAGVTDSLLITSTYVLSGVFVLWSVVALVLAALVWRGVSWARIVLLISTFGAVGLGILGLITSFVMAVPLVAAILTVVQLVRPESAAWVARR